MLTIIQNARTPSLIFNTKIIEWNIKKGILEIYQGVREMDCKLSSLVDLNLRTSFLTFVFKSEALKQLGLGQLVKFF